MIDGIHGLRALVGQELGTSSWVTVDQPLIDAFASLTGDHQWIHNDVERASRESIYGTTIAHGYLILSLSARLVYEVFDVARVKMAINYGLDRVRFLTAVPSGARLRLRVSLAAARDSGEGVLTDFDYHLELEGSDRPACVARKLTLYVQ